MLAASNIGSHGFPLYNDIFQGGVFDINAFFYKRLVQAVVTDGTLAQQCAFVSTVHPIPMHYNREDFSKVKVRGN